MAGIKFYLDEHVSRAVAKGLRQRGMLVFQVLSPEEMRNHVEFL